MAISVVGTAAGTAEGVPSLVVEYASSNNSTLVAVVGANAEGASPEEACRVSSVVDDAHNSWFEAGTAFAAGPADDPYTGTRVSIWVCPNAAPVQSITVTMSQTADSMAVRVREFFGITNVDTLDSNSGGSVDNDDDGFTTSLVTLEDETLVLAAATAGDSGLTLEHDDSGGSGWTHDTDVTTDTGEAKDDVLLRSAYMLSTSSGSKSKAWEVSDEAPVAWVMVALRGGSIDDHNPNDAWPQVIHELGFGIDPNDPDPVNDSVSWVNVTNRVTEFACRRGRDYELARTEAGEADVRMRNDDGALTPGNEDSPYHPNVRVFTPYRCRARWNGKMFPVFTGYVERWPMVWDDEYGTAPLVAVDGLATLSATRLEGTLAAEILADNPWGFWPLDDGRLAEDAANKSTNSTASLAIEEKGTAGSGSFGADLDLQGEESTCWSQERRDPAETTSGVFLAGSLALPQLDPGILVECWAKFDKQASTNVDYTIFALKAGDDTIVQLRINADSGAVAVDVAVDDDDPEQYTGGNGFNDGKWRHYAVHVTETEVRLWIDGDLANGDTTLNGTPPSSTIDTLSVGGTPVGTDAAGIAVGQFSHVAVWELSAADERRIAIRRNAGMTGFNGDYSGQRISRLLNYAGWTAGRSIDAGLSRLGGSSTIAKQTLLQAVQDVANWENGLAFVDAAGTFRFVDRHGRFYREPKWTFGDNPAVGEIPYETDVEIQYDPKYVYNDVTVTKTAGRTSTGGGSARRRDQESVKAYFMRTLDKTSGVAAVSECIAEAEWTLENYSEPRLRLSSITICPSANPDLWTVALTTEIGDRVLVKRRPFGGSLIELDCYVEQVSHQVTPGSWKVTYSLSPVLKSTYEASQAWVLGISTLGVDTYLG